MSAPAKSCPSCGEHYGKDVLFCPRDGTPIASSKSGSSPGAERDAYVGVELPGQIRIESLIGIGSMGRVYRAFQGGIDRDVAVKILHRELSANAELVARFHREAKVASRLVHPHVVQVLMTGSLPHTRDPKVGGELYLVMEHLDGISLLSALAAAGTEGEGSALPLPRALRVALQICDAVGEAHAQGIVHRDLKPENVMLVKRGEDRDFVKVLDFGIARLDWADRSLATQAGLIFGTAKYISPEGAEGHPVGPPADVYSIATMLYQMLAGRTPFEGDSPVALLVQHTHTPPPALRTIARASYVPAPLASVIMANLSKKPSDRAEDARALGRELFAAARASGLVPEEIAASALFSTGSGAVKLASRERTKSHELSADLADKIGGVAAAPREGDPLPSSKGDTSTFAGIAPLSRSGSVPASASAPSVDVPRAIDAGAEDPWAPPRSARVIEIPRALDVTEPSPSEAPITDPSPTMEEQEPRVVTPPPLPKRSSPVNVARTIPEPTPTIHGGTETSLEEPDEPPPRSRLERMRRARYGVIIALALLLTPLVIFGGRRLQSAGDVAGAGSLDVMLDDARDCLKRRAYDAPKDQNVKDITDKALARHPGNQRVIELRREAAERIVADALGRKYAGDMVEAKRLAELALALSPDLTTAQHLVAEMNRDRAPDIAPASSASASAKPRKTTPRDRPPEPKASADAPRKPDKRDPVKAPTAEPTGAVLPPDPRPDPRPPSSGPWL